MEGVSSRTVAVRVSDDVGWGVRDERGESNGAVRGLRFFSEVFFFFFFQAEDGIRDVAVTGVQTCALPIFLPDRDVRRRRREHGSGCTGAGRRRLRGRRAGPDPGPDGGGRPAVRGPVLGAVRQLPRGARRAGRDTARPPAGPDPRGRRAVARPRPAVRPRPPPGPRGGAGGPPRVP